MSVLCVSRLYRSICVMSRLLPVSFYRCFYAMRPSLSSASRAALLIVRFVCLSRVCPSSPRCL